MKTRLLFAVPLVLGLVSCSTSTASCPGGGESPLLITVLDTSTGQYVCNAQITAVDGSASYSSYEFQSSDAALSDASSCSYLINPHKSGSYTVVVSAPGFQMTQSSTVNLQFDDCGAVETSQFITIMVSPS